MEWALVNCAAECVPSSLDDAMPATAGVLARLPANCHNEFKQLLDEACTVGQRRRLCITNPGQPTLLVDILPLKLDNPDEYPALVVIHNSSELDSSAERFRRLARRNEAILLSSMDGFFVVDEDCRFLEVNEAFCRMTGYSSAELMNMRITDIEVDQHDNGGVPSHTGTGLHHFPTAHRHKDGHLVHLEISVNVLHDNGHKILVGFARDITRRLRAEEEFARLSRQQKLILDSAAEGIVGLDAHGHISFVNPAAAEWIGCNTTDLIGLTGHEALLAADDDGTGPCAQPECPVCAVLREQRHRVRGDGSTFPVEYSATVIRDGGTVMGAVLVFRDITEQRRAAEQRRLLETQMQQAQKLESLGLLAGGIAHDLNNMLAGIQGHASLALAEVPEGTRVGERLRRIVGACERAANVIQQILAYSGQVSGEPTLLDLNEQIEEMTEFMRAAVPRNITLDVRLVPELPKIEADSGQLQQVITNLLVNAVEAIGDHTGRITVSTSLTFLSEEDIQRDYSGQGLEPGAYAALCVEDTGCGMSPDVMERIFEPFYSQKGPGRGLGLSAMHGVIRAQHGAVRVESEPAKGSRFVVVFPAARRSARAPQPPAPPHQVHAGTTVLVIDDEDEVRDVIKDMLSYRGMRVLTAGEGARGVELFREHADEIDVVLLDMTMPGMSGGEVFEQIVSIRPDTKVIISSGYSTESVASRFAHRKPAGFVHKPFTADTLMQGISQVLRNGKATTRV